MANTFVNFDEYIWQRGNPHCSSADASQQILTYLASSSWLLLSSASWPYSSLLFCFWLYVSCILTCILYCFLLSPFLTCFLPEKRPRKMFCLGALNSRSDYPEFLDWLKSRKVFGKKPGYNFTLHRYSLEEAFSKYCSCKVFVFKNPIHLHLIFAVCDTFGVFFLEWLLV